MSSVLIVDDARFMRNVLKNILEKNPSVTKIYEAIDGDSAMDVFQKEKPDLITMDINMPHTDGLTCLKKIISLNRNAKVLMITSVEQESIINDAMNSGAKGYIQKPFNEHIILNKIDELLN